MRRVFFLALAGWLIGGTASFATGVPRTDSVESNRAAGWNCTARVDRGEGKLVTNQQEGRP